ncbi:MULTISPECIES: DUF4301 family protein [unclassified Ekhidna]|uniref:DUF4301 family protein n=1 Tax=unclassified Ekhidna TaxID=2632188 RepID=UPI0032DF5FC9
MFSEEDKNQIVGKGIRIEKVESQLNRFKKGFAPANISKAATVGDGILRLSKEEIDGFQKTYEKAEIEVLKFVPASGAATRMFKTLFAFLEEFDGTESSFESISREEKKVGKFFQHIDEFAFYDELDRLMQAKKGKSIADAKKTYTHDEIVSLLLTEEGLNYGKLPKGLLSFHKYENETRTPAQEHLFEGMAYANKSNQIRIHFTVSPEHHAAFESHIQNAIAKLDSDSEFSVSYSTQKPETDTIAATPTFEPFRDEAGKLLFRPAGHGALLQNLDEVSADLIFIKNIDNVVPDRLKLETIRYKKALAGVLLNYQKKTFDLLKRHDAGEDICNEGKNLLEEMGVRAFADSEIPELLNRPIRVCGMVKNEGEPGGGPFWVKNEPAAESLQIVESAQIDKSNPEQRKAFKNGTHFNPVDLVCGVKNYKGEKFSLLNYRDEEAGFISEKSYQGKQLLAMELPGLWNGAMAHWNTIFVEVPLITFNPVKTVTDLLKPTHH